MSCNCESRLDSIMKFLEGMRAEMKEEIGAVNEELGNVKKELGTVTTQLGTVKEELGTVKEELGTVKTKAIRIEKEILGITAESELNAEALMETTTVRHIVEKLAFDVDVLTEEIKLARAESKRQKEMDSASKDLPRKFTEALDKKINELQLKYDIISPKTFQAGYSNFLEDFRSQTERDLLKKGISSSIIHGMVKEVAGTADSETLYKTHFSDQTKKMEIVIRDQYGEVVEAYAHKAIERIEDSPKTGLNDIIDFLNQFKLCEVSLACFQEELLKEFQQITEDIQANQSLLDQLTKEHSENIPFSFAFDSIKKPRYEVTLEKGIRVSYPMLVPLFLKKLRDNIEENYNAYRNRNKH